jgi:hypothetical protein
MSMKIGLEKDIAVTGSWELPEFWEFNERTYWKVYFFMLSCLIFNPSVDRGISELGGRTI